MKKEKAREVKDRNPKKGKGNKTWNRIQGLIRFGIEFKVSFLHDSGEMRKINGKNDNEK